MVLSFIREGPDRDKFRHREIVKTVPVGLYGQPQLFPKKYTFEIFMVLYKFLSPSL